MTYLCYTLTEAAQKLALSETVLIRLSQFLKVPTSAYDSQGYSRVYRDDLTFTEPDLRFFTDVKERLLKGDSLEQIKLRVVRPYSSLVPTDVTQGPSRQHPASLNGNHIQKAPAHTAQASAEIRPVKQGNPRLYPAPLSLQQTADKIFQRYKGIYRSEKPAVFSRILSALQREAPVKPVQTQKASVAVPQSAPVMPQSEIHPEPIAQTAESSSKFDYMTDFMSGKKRNPQPPETVIPSSASVFPSQNPQTNQWQESSTALSVSQQAKAFVAHSPWENLIQAAVEKPRPMNVHLRTAAEILKLKALHRQQGEI